MLKTVKIGERALFAIRRTAVCRRLFLSEAYQCQEAWNRRLESPILKKTKPTDMFFQLEQKFNNLGKASPIDIDIFVNTIVHDYQVEELLQIIHSFRLCGETSNTLESTHKAVIRYLLDKGFYKDLLEVLHDRLNYGIFPDHYCYNLLMDYFIKKEEFAFAAQVAVLLMLQEDAENSLANALCIYSCHKYLENPDTWTVEEVKVDDTEEEVKVRVAYLRNPFFDDHFDLRQPRDLVGKTLAFQGKCMGGCLGRTLQLRGLILYKKYKEVFELITKWIEGVKGHIVYEEIFDLVKKDNNNIPQDQITEEYKNVHALLETLKKHNLCKDSLSQTITNNVTAAVTENEENEIQKEIQNLQKYEITRQEVMDKEIEQINRKARLERVTVMKKELEEKEEILTFFDKEEEIELQIEEKLKKEAADDLHFATRFNKSGTYKKLVKRGDFVPPELPVKAKYAPRRK